MNLVIRSREVKPTESGLYLVYLTKECHLNLILYDKAEDRWLLMPEGKSVYNRVFYWLDGIKIITADSPEYKDV